MSNDNNVYLVENTAKLPVMIGGEPVGPVHEFITKAADKDTGLPVAFGRDYAEEIAELVGGKVVDVTDTNLTVAAVILHPTARKLPSNEPTMTFAQQVVTSM